MHLQKKKEKKKKESQLLTFAREPINKFARERLLA